ncbi:Aquaporin-4 [Mactra antiquata]
MDGYFLSIASKLDSIRLQSTTGKLDILRELKSFELWRGVLAEFLATMLFVFIGTMSAVDVVNPLDLSSKFIRIAFTFGLMITVCIQMIGHVSGGHMNPAVSIAMAVSMTISPSRALLYVVAQSGGAMIGSLLLKGVTPSTVHSNLGLTLINDNISDGQGFACELIFTFILVMSIYGCTDPNRPFFGSPALGIGLTVGCMHLAGIPFTGASMNPARSLGSALISDDFEGHWVYWCGPILGGILAALTYKYIFNPYRKCISYDEATEIMLQDKGMVVIPRDYFKKNEETTNGQSIL